MASKKDIGIALKGQLDQLKASPDDVVWTNIESQLRKKKRRRLLILFFIGGLITLFSGTLWYSNSLDTPENIKSTEIEINNNTTTPQSTIIADIDTLQPSKPERENSRSTTAVYKKSSTKQNPYYSNKFVNSDADELPEPTTVEKENSMPQSSPSNTKESLNISELNEEQNEVVSADSTAIKTRVEDTTLTEKTKDSVDQKDRSRWSFTPHIIGSTYGAFNETTADNFSINYGLFVSYRISDKAYVRTGIRRLDLQQSIDSISIRSQYLEIPFEVKYAPFNTKLNPHVTGGLSYFVLQDSDVSSSSFNDFKTTLGVNFGLGIETRIFNRLYLNLESSFNYQLKPFSGSNDIHPYIFSIQTGIEYRF